MRHHALKSAYQATMGPAVICLSVISLTGCGSAADDAEKPSATPAGASSSPASGSGPAKPGNGGGAYCDVFRDQGATLLLLLKASEEADPAKVKADFDSVVAVYQALADAAPPELRTDAELVLKTFKDDREVIAQAGWKSLSVRNTVADDLRDDAYVNAAGHQMTYLQDVCHVDPANPAAVPTRSS